MITELVIGGGGRLFAIGPISARMVLFGIALIVSIYWTLKGSRLPRDLAIFLYTFVALMITAFVIGLLAGSTPVYYWQDIKPLTYVLVLPFFYFVLDIDTHEKIIGKIIIFGSVCMAFAFVAILIAVHSGALPFLLFYDKVLQTQEFFFRAETTFFYKGFIYICIAVVFAYFTNPKFKTAFIIIFSSAILLSITRGFVFAIAFTFLFQAVLERRIIQGLIMTFLIIAVVFFSKPVIYNASSTLHEMKSLGNEVPKEALLGNREESDEGRVSQMKQVLDSVTPFSIILGHGFGQGIPARPVHMEISYLEIFHKQGLLGLAVWSYLFWLLLYHYSRTPKRAYTKAFFFSACLIFFQSLTNQYVNNPIGMSFVLLALCYLTKSSSHVHPTVQPATIRNQKSDEISISST